MPQGRAFYVSRGNTIDQHYFCAQCYNGALQLYRDLKNQKAIEEWKATLTTGVQRWTEATVLTTGALGSLGITIGGMSAMVAAGTAALITSTVTSARSVASTISQISVKDGRDE